MIAVRVVAAVAQVRAGSGRCGCASSRRPGVVVDHVIHHQQRRVVQPRALLDSRGVIGVARKDALERQLHLGSPVRREPMAPRESVQHAFQRRWTQPPTSWWRCCVVAAGAAAAATIATPPQAVGARLVKLAEQLRRLTLLERRQKGSGASRAQAHTATACASARGGGG